MTTSEMREIGRELAQALTEHIEDNPTNLSDEDINRIVEEAHQEIPTNSATLLVDEATSRFSSAIWYENIQKKTVILAGVGGIGRFGNLINF